MKKLSMTVAAMILLMTFTVQAERAQRRMDRQQGRIAGGVASGSLTRVEAKKLRKGQQRVDHIEDKAMADDSLSVKEKIKIEKAQDRQSRRIYKQKHDLQTGNAISNTLSKPAESAQDSNVEGADNR
jgi:hypothetical protein